MVKNEVELLEFENGKAEAKVETAVSPLLGMRRTRSWSKG